MDVGNQHKGSIDNYTLGKRVGMGVDAYPTYTNAVIFVPPCHCGPHIVVVQYICTLPWPNILGNIIRCLPYNFEMDMFWLDMYCFILRIYT